MHRSFLHFLRRQINVVYSIKACDCGSISRSCNLKSQDIAVSCLVSNKSFHTNVTLRAGDDDVRSKQKSTRRDRNTGLTEDEKLESAAVEAAKSLPGDWTRTAEELISRLSTQVESQPDSSDQDLPVKKSLLSTMQVGRGFERKKTGFDSRSALRQEDIDPVAEKMFMRRRLARKSENFTSLYSQPRLGIFDADKVDGTDVEDLEDVKVSLWQVVARENIEKIRHGLPRNEFEEMVEWTKNGQMWTFPVDNEEYMTEERQYKFHEHILLGHHLRDFPSDGPLRRFMDLVVLGLSKNPWISVPEKVEHIHWYADYFRQKQQLLESSIGVKAEMKQPER